MHSLCYAQQKCRVSYEVTKSSNTIDVQLQIIQYIFRTKILFKDTPSFRDGTG